MLDKDHKLSSARSPSALKQPPTSRKFTPFKVKSGHDTTNPTGCCSAYSFRNCGYCGGGEAGGSAEPSGDSTPISVTRKSSAASQDWQLRRSYSNSSQLTPYSKTFSVLKGSRDDGSTHDIVRSCSSQIFPYGTLSKESSVSLHYSPKSTHQDLSASSSTSKRGSYKDHSGFTSSLKRGSIYRPKSLHMEDKLPQPLVASRQHYSAGELKKIDSNFLHPHCHISQPVSPVRENAEKLLSSSSGINDGASGSGASCSSVQSYSSACETTHGFPFPSRVNEPKFYLDRKRNSQLIESCDGASTATLTQGPAPSSPTVGGGTSTPTQGLPPTPRMYQGDLPPRRLPKSGSDCTLAIPASHRKVIL